MKKTLLISALITVLFLFTSCSDDTVSLVQNGYFGEFTDLTVQEILDGHYEMIYKTTTWDGGATDSGEEIVQVQYSDSIINPDDVATIQFKVYDNNIFKVSAVVDPDYEIKKASDAAAVLDYLYYEQYAVNNKEAATDNSKASLFIERLDNISVTAVLYGAPKNYSEDRGRICEIFDDTPLELSVVWLLDNYGLINIDLCEIDYIENLMDGD